MSNKEHKCNICIKVYASYKSLWLHKKKFHSKENNSIINNVDIKEIININENKIINCEYCNKIFSSRFSKSEHKKKACKLNPNNYNNSINNDIIELKNKNDVMTNSIKELKELLIKNCKVHPKTLQKINKNLINNSNYTTNNNITNNINNTIINKTYVNFNDSINYKLLTENEILNILNRQWKCLEESIKTVHFNKKYPEHNNILITNLKDNNAYIFDGIKFSAISKDEAIHELINSHVDEIEMSKNKYEHKISEYKLKNINKFINLINNNEKKYYHEIYNKTYPNYKIYKCDLIKQFIYNYSNPKILDKLKNINLENKVITYDESSDYEN